MKKITNFFFYTYFYISTKSNIKIFLKLSIDKYPFFLERIDKYPKGIY